MSVTGEGSYPRRETPNPSTILLIDSRSKVSAFMSKDGGRRPPMQPSPTRGEGKKAGNVLATLVQAARAANVTGAVDAQIHRSDLHPGKSPRNRHGACRNLAVAADPGGHSVRRPQCDRCGAAPGVRSPRGATGSADRDR